MIFEDEVDELTNRSKWVKMNATSGGDELFLSRLMEILDGGELFEITVIQGDIGTRWSMIDSEEIEE